MKIDEKKKINILLASDENYADKMGILIYSIMENCPKSNLLNFYVLDGGIPNKEKNKLKLQSKEFKSQIFFYELGKVLESSNLKNCSHLGRMTYARLFFADLLPNNLTRIIYLDSDIVVLEDIQKLFSKDLGENIVGAAPEITGFLFEDHLKKFNLHPRDYFNAGVLVINVKKWKKEKIKEKTLSLSSIRKEKIKWGDQEILNEAINGRWKRLEYSWNTLFLYHRGIPFSKKTKEMLIKTRKNPKLIHFGGGKNAPWNYYSSHPKRDVFRKYKRESYWNEVTLENKNLRSFIVKIGDMLAEIIPWKIKRLIIKFYHKIK